MATGGGSLSKLSEETFDFICTACDKANRTSEAVRYCVECSGYCCQECTDLHSRFPTLENHNLLDVGQGDQASKKPPKLPEFPIERCNIHQGKVLDMYCEHHDVVGCSICISTNHRYCRDSQIHFIPDVIDSLFNISRSKQVQTNLKDLMVSLTTSTRSKGEQLDTLTDSKHEALEKVAKFQKTLESVIKEIAEMSRKEVEEMYINIEKEILQAKLDLMKINDGLQEASEKIEKAGSNRAQRFVCTKVAEKRITETEMTGKENVGNTDTKLSFTPNQSLMDYMIDLDGIGEVSTTLKMKEDLYTVKVSKDINIVKPDDDSPVGYSPDCCLTFDNNLLVTDTGNKKLKRIDTQTLRLQDYCDLDRTPKGVCCINEHEAAVTCEGKMIQIVSIDGNMMKPTKQIKLSHECFGIASYADRLYITDNGSSLYIHDMEGKLLKTISNSNTEIKMFSRSRRISFGQRGKKVYVSDWVNGIICFKNVGKYLSAFNDSDIKCTDGISVDFYGNMFVVGWYSNKLIQFNEKGKKIGVIISEQEGLYQPSSVCFDQKLKRLFVTMDHSDVVKMYELE